MSIEFSENSLLASNGAEMSTTRDTNSDPFHEELNKTRMEPIGMTDGDRVTQAAVAFVQQALKDQSIKSSTTGEIKITENDPEKVEITTPNGSEFVKTDRRVNANDGSTMIAYYEDRDVISDPYDHQLFSIDEMDSGNIFQTKINGGYFTTCQATLSGIDGKLLNGFVNGVSMAPREELPEDGRFKESVFHVTDAAGRDLQEQVVVIGKFTGADTASVTATLIKTDKDGKPLTWEDDKTLQVIGSIKLDLTINPENPQGVTYNLTRDGMSL